MNVCIALTQPWYIAQDIRENKYRALFTGPEMCMKHSACKDALAAQGLSGAISTYVIDEAHCISLWGGEFRPTYSGLSRVRAHVPRGTPVACLSATMEPRVLSEIEQSMEIDPNRLFHLNLGNDRPNVKQRVVRMKNAEDFETLDRTLDILQRAAVPSDIRKTLVFANTRTMTLRIWQHLRDTFRHLPPEAIGFLHANRRKRARQRVMNEFISGKIRLLVSTEVTGMVRHVSVLWCICVDSLRAKGQDIPDIERVIQFGLAPSCSLAVWTQRAGRAGRSPDIRAEAILLVEEAAFMRPKPAKVKRVKDPDKSRENEVTASVSADERGGKKAVESSMLVWLACAGCRRDASDEYFNNPLREYGEWYQRSLPTFTGSLRKLTRALCPQSRQTSAVTSATLGPSFR